MLLPLISKPLIYNSLSIILMINRKLYYFIRQMCFKITYHFNIKTVGISHPVKHLTLIFTISCIKTTEHYITFRKFFNIFYHFKKKLSVNHMHIINSSGVTDDSSTFSYIINIFTHRSKKPCHTGKLSSTRSNIYDALLLQPLYDIKHSFVYLGCAIRNKCSIYITRN